MTFESGARMVDTLLMLHSLVLCFWFLVSSVAQAGEPVYHVVFDIDWTLTSVVDVARDHWQWVKVKDETYRVADHLGALMKKLADDPTVKISFFSGGNRARNYELLKKIKPPELGGKSLYDIAYKILSQEELKEIDPHAKHWANRYLKDLKLVSPDLKNVILVDDARGFITHNHGKGIWLGKTYRYFDTYEEVIAARKLQNSIYIPPSREAWLADRNRLVRVDGILQDSLKAAKERRGAFANLVVQRSKQNCLTNILGVSFKKP